MQIKNLVIIIFVIILLATVYVFSMINNNNISCKNNIISNIPNKYMNIIRKDTFNSKTTKSVPNDDNSNVNNKIKIKNRDNSLLHKLTNSDSKDKDTDKQNAKLFQKGIREDIEKDASKTLIKLKDISEDESTGLKTYVPIADTLINNDKYKGYNNYDSLRKDSYAPVTSIGKKLITPFASYPIAC